ncbi:MAG: nucleotidyltransferase family protein [Euryarchaeota archaeon]|nr:nucleotidyltransferase family protein [Euryarchaeota archaeon]
MLTSEHIMKTLNLHRKEIQGFGVKRIGLFGSFRTNNQHRNSDIDILVEFKKEKKTFDNYMDLKFFLEKTFDRSVDLVMKEAVKLELKTSILKSVRYAAGF